MLTSVRDNLETLPVVTYAKGEVMLAGGTKTGKLMFLEQGRVGIVREGVTITKVTQPGAVFGEMSLLLDVPHTADVVALDETTCRVAIGGAELLARHPDVTAYVAAVLAHRLHAATRYLVDLKNQYAGQDDHFGMIDEILDSLVNRHPKALSLGGPA